MRTQAAEYEDGSVLLSHSQSIPKSFTDELAQYRQGQSAQRCKNYHRVACIPSIFILQFKKEGFDVLKESPRAIVNYLKRKGLTAFLTTDKSV